MDAKKFLSTVTPEQRKWVIERLQLTSDAAAARAVGVHPSTVCKWPNKAQLDLAVQELLKDPQQHALEILTHAVVDAARAKAEGIRVTKKDGTKTWHQGVATEILNRILGAPVQRSELSGPEGKAIELIADVRSELERKLRQAVDDGP